jgi:regulator of sigma E protease
MMDTLLSSVFAFVVAIALLVAVHEYGHFWTARRCGVRVLRFSIGFGPVLWSRRGKQGTEYAISALPLGGYVKMLDEREGPVDAADLPHAFNRQSLAKRSAIVFAGPLANFLFAIFAFWLVHLLPASGIKPVIGEVVADSPAARAGLLAGSEIRTVNQEVVHTWQDAVRSMVLRGVEGDAQIAIGVDDGDGALRTRILALPEPMPQDPILLLDQWGLEPWRPQQPAVIGEVFMGEAAAEAGLQAGDEILAVNGEPVQDWQDWVLRVRAAPEQRLRITLLRQGVEQQRWLTPRVSEDGRGARIGRIGAALGGVVEIPEDMQVTVQAGPLEAMVLAWRRTAEITRLTLKVLGRMLVGAEDTRQLGGPVTIAQQAGASAAAGTAPFLAFLALISLSLGILNLLPIPVLDGGHLLFYAVEWLRGRPLSERVQGIAQQLGMAAILGLMFLALFNDVLRILGP